MRMSSRALCIERERERERGEEEPCVWCKSFVLTYTTYNVEKRVYYIQYVVYRNPYIYYMYYMFRKRENV
jgi:hypothetical protein